MDAFPPDFQKDVLAHLIYSTRFLRGVFERIKPDHFSGKEFWILCTLTYDYFDKYGRSPGSNLRQEVAKYVRRSKMSEDSAELLAEAFEQLEKPRGDSQYLLDEIDAFIKHQAVRGVLEEFIPKYHRGDYDLDDFTREISEIQNRHTAKDEVRDVFGSVNERVAQRLVKRRSKPIATLIDPLDERIVGLEPPKLCTVLAPSGIGKSFFCCHIGKAATLQGNVVFHYTGEMLAEEVIQRYDQMLVGTNVDGLLTPGTSRKLMLSAKNLQRQGGKLFVDFFPFPSTVSELRRDISRKIAAHGTPGLIIVDAAERLEPSKSTRNKPEAMGLVWQALRQINIDFGTCMYATNQGNLGSVGAKLVTERENAFSYEVIRVSDIVIGFNRNMVYNQRTGEWKAIDEEYNADVIRAFLIKNRGRSDKHEIRWGCDLDRSQIYSRTATQNMLRTLSEKPRGKKKRNYLADQADIDD